MGVAGGAVWTGENAPDGHEMGCLLFYHYSSYNKKNDVWCQNEYYCTGSYLAIKAYKPKNINIIT